MGPLLVSIVVFSCLLISFEIGIRARRSLPASHFNDDSKFVVELCLGMVAAMTALVLGLLTASTKNTFDDHDSAIKNLAGYTLELDRVLKKYGDEAADVRSVMKNAVSHQVDTIWKGDDGRAMEEKIINSRPIADEVEGGIRALTPQSDIQKELRQSAFDVLKEIVRTRFHILTTLNGSIPAAFLIIMTFWLALLFGSFGLYAPRNATVYTLLSLSAISVAAGIFVILEMGTPYAGVIKVSSAPIERAIERMGQ